MLPHCFRAECVVNNSPLDYKEVLYENLKEALAKLDDLKAVV